MIPSQNLEFLGFQVDILLSKLFLPQKGVTKRKERDKNSLVKGGDHLE